MKVEVRRSGNLQSGLAQLRARIDQRVSHGLAAAAVYVRDESVKQCPDDTGYLQETARVTLIGAGLDTVAVVGYGGQDFPPEVRVSPGEGNRRRLRYPYSYAVIVHEDPTKAHPTGNFKFLSNITIGQTAEIASVFFTAAVGGKP